MATNDYFTIVYRLLTYLYNNLKKGEKINTDKLQWGETIFRDIPETYRMYIFRELLKSGLVQGYAVKYADNEPIYINLDRIEITPAGIQYLEENSMMQKAKSILKDAKDILPI